MLKDLNGYIKRMIKKKIEKELLSISFSFDNLDILGAFKNKVYLRGEYYKTEEFESKVCVIVISKELFHKSLDLWLKDKKEYCEKWNHFCGTMGRIESTKHTELNKTELLTGFNEEKEELIYERVRTFEIKKFENSCDMEHG